MESRKRTKFPKGSLWRPVDPSPQPVKRTLDNTAAIGSTHEPQIQQLIQALPKRLRRQRPLSLGWIRPSTGLCGLHKPLNGDLIQDILYLIQREVTKHFRQFNAYPELIQSVEAEILASLRALQGMWTKPSMDNPVAPQAWAYQINGCQACMLARIAADSETVRNLRVVLQSRTRTRKSHRAPTLTAFIDECISQFGGDDADELFGTASNFAYEMKAARKACVKAWFRDPDREDSGRSKRKHSRREKKSDGSSDRHRRRQTHVPTVADIPEGIAVPSSATHPQHSSTSKNSLHDTINDRDARPANRSAGLSPEPRRLRRRIPPGGSASAVPGSASGKPRRIVQDSTPSVHTWEDVERELNMINSYQELAKGNPYSRATPIPGTKVAPLRVGKMEPQEINGKVGQHSAMGKKSRHPVTSPPTAAMQGYESEHSNKQSTLEVPLKYQYSPSDYSSSDYWTDASCDDSDYDAPPRKAPLTAAMTTWSLVCDEGNVI